jgi:acyl-CoA synthetase (AMP-forming)/AMP-acid ligase II
VIHHTKAKLLFVGLEFAGLVDELRGQLPTVRRVFGIGGDGDGRPGVTIDPEALLVWCLERMAAFKCPKSVDVVAELPRNPTGKILKKALREPYWEGRERRTVEGGMAPSSL